MHGPGKKKQDQNELQLVAKVEGQNKVSARYDFEDKQESEIFSDRDLLKKDPHGLDDLLIGLPKKRRERKVSNLSLNISTGQDWF